MRFATFVTFMLPLAAFAAPTPSALDNLDDLCAILKDAPDQLGNSFGTTIRSLAVVVAQIGASDNSQELAVVQDVKDAENELLNSFTSVGTAPIDGTRYVNSLCAYTMVKNELIWRFCSL